MRRNWLLTAGISALLGLSCSEYGSPDVGRTGSALNANPYASGLTAPAGALLLGQQLWVADHAQGFCRLDETAPGSGAFAIAPSTCNVSAVSPGQPAFDAATNFVYIPDNSSKSQGVWRLKFDPVAQTVGSPVLLAPGKGLSGNRATAVALGPGGNLYVGFLKTGDIKRVTSPSAANVTTQTVQSVGTTTNNKAVKGGIAFLGGDLYIAENAGISLIGGAASCAGACTAAFIGLTGVAAPSALTSVQPDALFIADGSNVLRYKVSTATLDILSTSGVSGTTVKPFLNISSLTVLPANDPSGSIYVGDDPTAGAQTLQGRLWVVPGGATPVPPAPPPGPTPSQGTAQLYASGATAPAGLVQLGADLWMSDHGQGFCRLDLLASGARGINVATCNVSATAPGQPSFDAVNNFVYVPDLSSKSQGVWRLTYNPATRTVGNAQLLAPNKGLSGLRTAFTALGTDGALYIASLKTGQIKKVPNPAVATSLQTVQSVGNTSDGRGAVGGLAFLGTTLYVGEGAGVTALANVASCTGGCTAASAGLAVTAPTALIAAAGALVVADTGVNVIRIDPGTGAATLLANTGSTATGTLTFAGVSGLGFDAAGNVYAGDDPTGGAQLVQGHVWQIAPAP